MVGSDCSEANQGPVATAAEAGGRHVAVSHPQCFATHVRREVRLIAFGQHSRESLAFFSEESPTTG